jgi:hypothetical protein
MDLNFYHYTVETRLDEIIESGEIKLATKSVYNKKEKSVAWVSSNEHWENTATKIAGTEFGPRALTFEEQVSEFGCARIKVKNIGLMTWAKLKHKASMNLDIALLLEKVGIEKGAQPSEWFGSLFPIKKSHWIKAEVYRDGKWVVYEDFTK